MLVTGIDEAGRGPLIGPMVLAAVWVEPARLRALRRIGVRDSKSFGVGDSARARRAHLAARVREVAAHVEVRVCEPLEVDRHVLDGGLDRLERACAAAMLALGPAPGRIVCDGKRLFTPLCARWPALRAYDRADARHAAVAAASIVAKDLRDRLFLERCAGCGDLAADAERGMGYINHATRAFLRVYVARHGRLPPGTRLTWGWPAMREILGRDPRGDLPPDLRSQLPLFAV